MLSRLLTRKEQAVLAIFAAAIALGAVALIVAGKHSAHPGITVDVDTSAAATAEASTAISGAIESPAAAGAALAAADATPAETVPPPVVVSVQGAVKKPGVYELAEGDRIQDLLEKAGGALDNANLIDINLAAKLADGTTLIVPSWDSNDYWSYQAASNPPQYSIHQQTTPVVAAEGAAPAAGSAAATSPASGLINLNTATQEQLESLPGIGPTYAQEIIRFRSQSPFRTVEDVGQVRGIGPKRLEAIRPLVTVR